MQRRYATFDTNFDLLEMIFNSYEQYETSSPLQIQIELNCVIGEFLFGSRAVYFLNPKEAPIPAV